MPAPEDNTPPPADFTTFMKAAHAGEDLPPPEEPTVEETPKEEGEGGLFDVSVFADEPEVIGVTPPEENPVVNDEIEEVEEIKLPDTASPSAREAFDKIKAERDEWKNKVSEVETNLGAESESAREEAIAETSREIQAKMDLVIEERDALKERVDSMSEKVQALDIQQDEQFIREHDTPIKNLESKANALFQMGESPAELIALAGAALQSVDDQEFYQGIARVADGLPPYAQQQVTGIMSDLRDRLVDRQRAVSEHEATAQKYSQNTLHKNKAAARDYKFQLDQISRKVSQEEGALAKFKETPEMKRILEPVKERASKANEMAHQLILAQVEATGPVSDGLSALALHGARRVEDAAMIRAVAIEHATLQDKYDKLVKRVGGDLEGERITSAGKGGPITKKDDEPKSLSEFMMNA